jgi:hypothetical protein
MIDDTKIELIISPPNEVRNQKRDSFIFNGLEFNHRVSNSGFIYYFSKVNNLRLKILGDRLIIENSWHKFRMGNNWSDFPLSEVAETYYLLNEQFNGELSRGRVKKISYGAVLNVDPLKNYPYWEYYKTKKPFPMYCKSGKVYGASFQLSDFKLKGYDKTFEVRNHSKLEVPENLFRIECEVINMRHLSGRKKDPIFINHPQDIFTFENIQGLGNDLTTKHQTIEKKSMINLEGLTTHQLAILGIMQNSEIRDHLRKNHNKTYKNYQRKLKSLRSGRNDLYFESIDEVLRQKISSLVNG